MSKEMKLTNKLYAMDMFEQLNMQEDSPIDYAIRVPGGWIFKFISLDSGPGDHVFVPFPNELQNRKA